MNMQQAKIAATPEPGTLPLPEQAEPIRLDWIYFVSLVFYHLVALLAFVPWFFSWTGVVVCLLGFYVFGTLGINVCYHRLLTHRGFVTPKWLERTLAILGVCSLQDTPARWVAIHRLHHQHADEREDPHSPLVNFLWGHMGWVVVQNRGLNRLGIFDRYAKDVLRDKFYVALERNHMWVVVVLASWAVFVAAGTLVGLAMGETLWSAYQFGLSLLVWGVFVRTVAVWHITWSVNSVAHRWGYRSYDTDEGSRNNVVVALLSNGEGWHNNHHADPRSARHGHTAWEFDVSWLTIRFLEKIGLATRVVLPSPHLKARRGGALPTRGLAVELNKETRE